MPTRRRFLRTIGLLAGGTLANWHARAPASPAKHENQASEFELIDCHTHFYDPHRPQGVPWPRKTSPLYRTVLPKHLRALPMPRRLTGTVVVEASGWVEDNQWLLDLAKDNPFIVGIVGNLAPGREDFGDDLRRFAEDRLFRGIRVGQGQVKLDDAGWMTDIRRLIEHDLALDVNGGPDTPQTVSQLARRLPELRIVINHIANVTIDGKQLNRDWVAGLRDAARHKNVFCKVSALVEGAARGTGGKAPKELACYEPTLDAVWDAFGDDRLIYGSNWPVCEKAADYATLQKIVLDYVSPRGMTAMRKFFAQNAKKAYDWVSRSPPRS